jgi:hypothetical protein
MRDTIITSRRLTTIHSATVTSSIRFIVKFILSEK